ncbi:MULTISPECIES: Flp family type IVb pilin [Leisingera]|uniref:Flp family type IVb pilin n=1 Tax=Leisingera TaxID=191028 RepID=UPI000427398A|nr:MULTISPECIES: hypothetical protein [Leisingera]
MIKFFKSFRKDFRKDESGAVTVDWVVLTAAVAALGGVVYTAVQDGASTLSSDTGSYLKGKKPT